VKLTQRSIVPVERERLWEFLMDVPRVGRCIPGVDEIQPLEDGAYRGVLRVNVGPIRLTLGGTITVEERDRNAWRASMRAEASDRKAAGGVRARMTLALLPAEGGTELVVETDLSVLGKIGEFGQPIIRKKADGIIQEFAANLEAALKV
jgi:carbon monoxide dehydrogenase subunit G